MLRNSWEFLWIDEPWVGGSVLKSSIEEKVKKSTKFVLEYYMPDKINAYLAARNGTALVPLTEDEKQALKMRSIVDHKFHFASNEMTEQSEDLEFKVYRTAVFALMVLLIMCCCICPYMCHLKRIQRRRDKAIQFTATAGEKTPLTNNSRNPKSKQVAEF